MQLINVWLTEDGQQFSSEHGANNWKARMKLTKPVIKRQSAYCEKDMCKAFYGVQPMHLEYDEPFAHCNCSTQEWYK
jgi:hypothetical protein